MSIEELERLELLMLYLKLALAKQDLMQASAIADEILGRDYAQNHISQ